MMIHYHQLCTQHFSFTTNDKKRKAEQDMDRYSAAINVEERIRIVLKHHRILIVLKLMTVQIKTRL